MMRIPEGQIRKRVKDELAEAAALVTEGARRDLLDLEIDRIDRLQLAVWDEALAGDRQAVETVLKLIMSRAKLLGLEDAASASSGIHTVVVQGNSEEYIAALRKIREHSEREAADGR